MIERFLKEGMSGFQDHEILEMLLFYTIPRGNTNGTAHLLIQEFGGLNHVLEADYRDLMRVKGVGRRSAVFLSTLVPLMQRYDKNRNKALRRIRNAQEACRYIRSDLMYNKNEELYLICLDADSRVLSVKPVAKGTIDQMNVYIRTMAEEAFKLNTKKVILAHSHPTDQIKPSPEDIEMTRKLSDFFQQVSIDLVDHVIVGKTKNLSFYAQKLINQSIEKDKAYAAHYELSYRL